LFLVLTEALRCENPGLNYPKAALFGFCVALLAYNVLARVKAALRAVHGGAIEQILSLYYVVASVSRDYHGMMIAVGDDQWVAFQGLTPHELATVLRQLARHVDLARYAKHPRGPKKPPKKRKNDPKSNHVSTAQILKKRNQKNP
jgi:hypothetical protein